MGLYVDYITYEKCLVQCLGHSKCAINYSCTYYPLNLLNTGTGIKHDSGEGPNW